MLKTNKYASTFEKKNKHDFAFPKEIKNGKNNIEGSTANHLKRKRVRRRTILDSTSNC